QTRTALAALPPSTAARAPSPVEPAGERPRPGVGEAVLATWHHLLDLGSLQDGEEHLAGTAKRAYAHLSAATAAEIEATTHLTVSTDRGAITLPLAVTEMPDRVVWVPTNSVGSRVRPTLGVDSGAVVRIAATMPEADNDADASGGVR
ncbi:MAG TPA: hypothetical protein VGR21_08435, partial [Cryptosporangiaceae bacterium]|nr:hypothetical protein [Cryptosporangiaceae bacterium]